MASAGEVTRVDHLEANQEVQLVVEGQIGRTRVIRRLGREIYVDALREGDKLMTPVPGQALELRFGDDFRFWSAPVVVADVLDPIPILVVRMMGPAHRIELRTAIRARLLVPLEYSLLRANTEIFTTTTLDLSASGLKFPCSFRTWLGLDLRMVLRVDQTDVALIGRVVRVAPRPTQFRSRTSWETAVQFVAPSPAARKRINELVKRELGRQQMVRDGRETREGGEVAEQQNG